MQRLALIILALLLLIFTIMPGCSQFKSAKRLDFAPFAEYTIGLAMDIEFGLVQRQKIKYLRPYLDDPVVKENRAEWDKVRELLRGVVAYSVELTTLGSSTLSGRERCRALAEFIENVAGPSIRTRKGRLHITPAELDSIVAEVRGRKDLLEGLAAVQPIIDEVARVSEDIFDEVKESLDRTATHLSQRIDEDNSDVTLYEVLIRQTTYNTFRTFILLRQYRTGDDAALDEMFELDPQLREYSRSGDSLTDSEIQAVEDRLVQKAQFTKELMEQIQTDIDHYYAQQDELAELYSFANLQLRKAKVTLIVWMRAHRDLARGITDPAKINLFDLTKKAAKTVM